MNKLVLPLQRAFIRDLFACVLVARFSALALGLAVILGVCSMAIYPAYVALIVVSGFLLIVGVAAQYISVSHGFLRLGPANIATTVRAALVTFVAGAIFVPAVIASHPWLLFFVAVVAFAMDGLDGMLARRSGMASEFGARYDMEIDALTGAVVSLVLLQSGKVGAEILVLGFMRYAFVAASLVWPWLNGSLPHSLRRKAGCVIQIGALIFLLCPVAPVAAITPVSVLASGALLWSFAIDILWLKRAAV